MSIEMTRVLKLIIKKFGIDTLRNGSRTIALFADFAPQCRKEMNMLQYLVKCNGHKLLLDARDASTDEQRAIHRRTGSHISTDGDLLSVQGLQIVVSGSRLKAQLGNLTALRLLASCEGE